MVSKTARLGIEERKERGSTACRRLRRSGRLPLNIYGLGKEARPVSADAHDVERLIELGEHVVELEEGGKVADVALLCEVQYDAIGSKILHADLVRVDYDKPVQVYVPIHYVGTAPEVADSVVEKVLDTIHVECLPGNIPHEVVVNLSQVEVGTHLTIADIEFPPGVKPFEQDPDDVVVANTHRAQVEEEAPLEGEEGEPAEPEVIGKKDGGDEDEKQD